MDPPPTDTDTLCEHMQTGGQEEPRRRVMVQVPLMLNTATLTTATLGNAAPQCNCEREPDPESDLKPTLELEKAKQLPSPSPQGPVVATILPTGPLPAIQLTAATAVLGAGPRAAAKTDKCIMLFNAVLLVCYVAQAIYMAVETAHVPGEALPHVPPVLVPGGAFDAVHSGVGEPEETTTTMYDPYVAELCPAGALSTGFKHDVLYVASGRSYLLTHATLLLLVPVVALAYDLCNWRKYVQRMHTNGMQLSRQLEYAVTMPLMMVMLASLAMVTDITTQVMVFTAATCAVHFSLMAEFLHYEHEALAQFCPPGAPIGTFFTHGKWYAIGMWAYTSMVMLFVFTGYAAASVGATWPCMQDAWWPFQPLRWEILLLLVSQILTTVTHGVVQAWRFFRHDSADQKMIGRTTEVMQLALGFTVRSSLVWVLLSQLRAAGPAA